MTNFERLRSLRETAALWHGRSGHDASAETRGALKTWLDQSPQHAAAFSSIDRTWAALKSAAQSPAILELRQEAAQRLPLTSGHRPRRWAAAALIIFLLGAALWIIVPRTGFELSAFAWLNGKTHEAPTQSYATEIGDRLTVALEDGSKVTLDTATQLAVTFTNKARTVRLSRGQALFEVARDVSRPFVVEIHNRRFIAVGTAFDVRLDGQQIKVTMLEGTVRTESIGLGSQIRTIVTAGEQLVANSKAEDRIRRVDPVRETSWRHGQVIFDNTPLSEAVEELNRYSKVRIELADPKLADLRLSGTFATGSTSAFVEAVTTYFSIKVDRSAEHTVTLRGRP